MAVNERRRKVRSESAAMDLLYIAVGIAVVLMAAASFLDPKGNMVFFPIIFFPRGSFKSDRRPEKVRPEQTGRKETGRSDPPAGLWDCAGFPDGDQRDQHLVEVEDER